MPIRMDILVIGESCLDRFIYGSCTRVAPEAPALVFNQSSMSTNPGMAMNTKKNIDALVDTDCSIFTNDNWKDITKTRYVDERTNQMFLRVDKGDDLVDKCDVNVLFDDYPTADAVIVSDYCKGFLTEKDIERIAAHYPYTFMDTKKTLGFWCDNVDYIKVNEHEYVMTKHAVDDHLATKIIITRGKDGCEHLGKRYPVPFVDMKDCAGAGDTFLAALVVKFSIDLDIVEAIEYGNACATDVIQKRGVSYVGQ